jgi:carboxylesterase
MGAGTDISELSTRKDWLEALCTAHDQLCTQCDTVLVGGVSAGSMLALRLAEMRPEAVQGLVIFAPTFWPNGWAVPRIMQLFKLFRTKTSAGLLRLRHREPFGIKDERMRKFIMESFKKGERPIEELLDRGGKLVFEFRRLAQEARRNLGSIKQRMLVFHPRHDDQSDISNAMILQREAGGIVEMLVLDDCYHMVTLDRQRGLVAERTVDFVQRMDKSLAAARKQANAKPAETATQLREMGAAE